MKKLLIILLALTLIIFTGCGDDNPVNSNNNRLNIVFNTAVGGANWEWGRDIVAVPSGGYVVTGWTDSYGQGRNDLYLIRIDNDGNVLWERNFGGTQNNSDDYGEGVTLTPDGNILAVGGSNSFDNHYENYIVKVDMDGNLIWEKTVDSTSYEEISKVFSVSDGYIIGGNVGDWDSKKYFVMKIDLDGNLVWDSVYNSSNSHFDCMIQTSDGGFVIGGTYILKIDQNGVPQWSDFTLGHTEPNVSENIVSLTESSDGSIFASGSQENNSTSSYELYVVKYTLNGTINWGTNYDIAGTGRIIANNNGTLTIVYNMAGNNYFAIINSIGELLSNQNTGIIGSTFDIIHGHTGYVLTGIGGTDPNGDVFIAEVEVN